MFEFEGFGARLQRLRKEKGMTQEELAGRVNVTGQAVSKWENGQAYPDITLIPTLVTILDTEIDHLFGKKMGVKTSSFPSTHAGMPLVHSTEYVACYSDKKVSGIDQTGVKFEDGSTAELSNRLVVNAGQGEIIFLAGDDAPGVGQEADPGVQTRNFELGHSQNLGVEVLNYDCLIVPSPDEKTRVKARGEAQFINKLRVEYADDKLRVYQEPIKNYDNRGHHNIVTIEMPCKVGNSVDIVINGSGEVTSEMDMFKRGRLDINGSGVIKFKSFETCTATINGSGVIVGFHANECVSNINGSGNISWIITKKAKAYINGSGNMIFAEAEAINLGINGSGDYTVKNMLGGGDCTAKINGSGNIKFEEGSCDKFDIDINGNGDIDATNLTARESTIVLHDKGSVTLGRVLEKSSEQIKKKGRIKILNRGSY